MEIVINKAKLEEIANWINTHCDKDTILDFFDYDDLEDNKITEKEVKEYIISTIESNLQYDFNFDFGLD